MMPSRVLGKGVRLYVPNLPASVASSLAAAGVAVESKPLTAPDNARRSRLVVSHGGLGLVSMTLAAGPATTRSGTGT